MKIKVVLLSIVIAVSIMGCSQSNQNLDVTSEISTQSTTLENETAQASNVDVDQQSLEALFKTQFTVSLAGDKENYKKLYIYPDRAEKFDFKTFAKYVSKIDKIKIIPNEINKDEDNIACFVSYYYYLQGYEDVGIPASDTVKTVNIKGKWYIDNNPIIDPSFTLLINTSSEVTKLINQIQVDTNKIFSENPDVEEENTEFFNALKGN